MRLFAAIELSDGVRSALKSVQDALRRSYSGVRWVRMDQVHLTVKFLGEVGDGTVAAVSEALGRGAGETHAFDMEVAGCGCFPPRGPVRVVWAGVLERSGTLLKCVEAIESQLEEIGFPRERRPFSPHLTLGRVREDRSGGSLRTVVESSRLDTVSQSVTSVVLISSVLSPKGPTYTVLSRAALGEGVQP